MKKIDKLIFTLLILISYVSVSYAKYTKDEVYDIVDLTEIKILNSDIAKAKSDNNFSSVAIKVKNDIIKKYELDDNYSDINIKCTETQCEFKVNNLNKDQKIIKIIGYGPNIIEKERIVHVGDTFTIDYTNDNISGLYYQVFIPNGVIKQTGTSEFKAMKKGLAIIQLVKKENNSKKVYDTVKVYVDYENYITETFNDYENNGITLNLDISSLDEDNAISTIQNSLRNELANAFYNQSLSYKNTEAQPVCTSINSCYLNFTIKYNNNTYSFNKTITINTTTTRVSVPNDAAYTNYNRNPNVTTIVPTYMYVYENNKDITGQITCISSNERIVKPKDGCYRVEVKGRGTATISFTYGGKEYSRLFIVGYNMGAVDEAAYIIEHTKYTLLDSEENNFKTVLTEQLENTVALNKLENIEIIDIQKKNNKYIATVLYMWNEVPSKEIELDVSIEKVAVKEKIIDMSSSDNKKIEFNKNNVTAKYTVADSSILRIDSAGNITALKPGKTTVLVEISSENYSDTITIYVDYETYIRSFVKDEYEAGEYDKIKPFVDEDLDKAFGDTIHESSVWYIEGQKKTKNIKISYVTNEEKEFTIENVRVKVVFGFENKVITLKVGETYDIKLKYGYFESKNRFSENEGIVCFDNDGYLTITAKSLGTTKVGLMDSAGEKHYMTVNVVASGKNGHIYNEITKNYEYYKNDKIDTTYNGVKDVEGTKYYFVKGITDLTFTGTYKGTSGTVYYINKGKVDTTFTGIKEHENKKYYLTKGILDTSVTRAYKVTSGTIYYVKKGVVDTTFTGLCKDSSGIVYSFKNGAVDTTFTGIKEYESKKYYLTKGTLDKSVTKAYKDSNGTVYYVKKGIVDTTFNGTYKGSSGVVYSFKNGVVDTTFTGIKAHESKKYYLTKGVLDTSVTKAYKDSNGTIYYVKKGIVDTTFTGIYKGSSGVVYSFKNGVVDTTFTGIKTYGGKKYYLKKGVLDTTFTGTYTGTSGTTYKVVKGIVQ